jgi:hypothetical protein
MVWLTSPSAICCEGGLDSWSIFLLDSRNMGQSFVRWLFLLPWNMQHKGLNLYGLRPRPQPRFGGPPL